MTTIFLIVSCKEGITSYKKEIITNEEVVFHQKVTIRNKQEFEDKTYELHPKFRDSMPLFPFATSTIASFQDFPHNEEGVPLLEYDGKNELYPVRYTSVALSYFTNYQETKSENSKERFLAIANHIKNNISYIDDFAVLQVHFKVNDYNLSVPWSSALAQGWGLGVVLQAYSLTKDTAFLEIASKMVNAFEVSIEKGGVLSSWDGYPFYEEYADPGSHVLNGYLFALAGLYYCYYTTGNEKAEYLFWQGVKTLAAKIHEYDAHFTSYYSKIRKKGSIKAYASAINQDPDGYHELVIYQLLTLYYWTGEVIFKEYAHKFLKYDTGKIDKIYDHTKFKSIEADHSIDPKKYGVNLLDDELWSWGNYWSTDRFPTNLVIEFFKEEQNIEAITFYSISEKTLPQNFIVHVCNDEGVWRKVCDSEEMGFKNQSYYKTGSYESFIETQYLPEPITGKAIKIEFTNKKKNIVTLREINIHFDRSDVVTLMLEQIRRKIIYK